MVDNKIVARFPALIGLVIGVFGVPISINDALAEKADI
jgi:hypothetical protein